MERLGNREAARAAALRVLAARGAGVATMLPAKGPSLDGGWRLPPVPSPSALRRVITLARLRSVPSIPLSQRLREGFKDVAGLMVTMGVILALVAVLWNNHTILYLPLVLVLAVAFSSFMGGSRQGLVSSGLALVFLAFYMFTQPITLWDRVASWLAWAAVLPGVAFRPATSTSGPRSASTRNGTATSPRSAWRLRVSWRWE